MKTAMKGSVMLNDNGERSIPTGARSLPRGGTIINILTGVIFFGLLAMGILWIMKTAGEAGKQYSTAMINTQDKSLTLACQMNFRSIAQSLQVYAIGNESFPASQQELVSYCGTSKLFRCPDPCGVDYVYLPGAGATCPPLPCSSTSPSPSTTGAATSCSSAGRSRP